jgi:hypothetical protein
VAGEEVDADADRDGDLLMVAKGFELEMIRLGSELASFFAGYIQVEN